MSYLFPRNAADHAAGQQFQNFEQAIEAQAETQCLKKDGFPGPPGALPLNTGVNTEFPDIAAIAQSDSTGFLQGYPAPYDPRRNMSGPEKAAYNAALSGCRAKAQAALQALDGSKGTSFALVQRWGDILFQTDASGPVIAAGRQAQACSQSQGLSFRPVNGRYEDGFLFAAQGAVAPLDRQGEHAQASANDKKVARTFVKCFGPLEALRDKLRTARRTQFFTENAQAIQQIQDRSNIAVAKQERQYGIKL